MRLHVRKSCIKQLLCALNSNGLYLVRIFLAAVIALAGVALRILVREHRGHRFAHCERHIVLGRNELNAFALALLLAFNRSEDVLILLPDVLVVVHGVSIPCTVL